MKKLTPTNLLTFFQHNWFMLGVVVILSLALRNRDADVIPYADTHYATQEASVFHELPQQHDKTQSTARKQEMSVLPISAMFFNEKPKEVKKIVKNQLVEDYKHVALEEQERFGIPAIIYLEKLNKANKRLIKASNNYFTVPCTLDWNNSSVTFRDACYRSYPSAWASFRDYSKVVLKKLEAGGYEIEDIQSIAEWKVVMNKLQF